MTTPSDTRAEGATASGADEASDRVAVGPLRPTAQARGVLRPASRARITGGLLHERRVVNGTVSVPDGFARLDEAGNFRCLRLAAGEEAGSYPDDLPFRDSDVYKWLEAVAWLQDDPVGDGERVAALRERVDEVVAMLRAAQRPNGYLQSYFQVVKSGQEFVDLRWGHELYCAGHLIQAAVAHARATGRTDVLDVARRVADHIDERFGAGEGRIDGVGGHPEIETALVELYRHTGERRYLDLASYFVERRGHGLLGDDRGGRAYWQDHAPVREATQVAGHAVRQLYLLAGVVDVATETDDASLLAAAERLWEDMVATKTYLTGGIGAHYRYEEFGDSYELPSERAYTETCAAIASVQFSLRLLLATGRARYAELIERTLYNGFLSGVSLSGDRYLYVNPLQVRDDHPGLSDGSVGDDQVTLRIPWMRCACCPPNVMRLLASLRHYVAAGSVGAGGVIDGLVLHQFVPGVYGVDLADGRATVHVSTEYPWQGSISVQVTDTPSSPWTVTLRLPTWASGHRLSVDGQDVEADADDAAEGWLRVTRVWRAGETLRLDIDLTPRLTVGDPRVDAVRGTVALERGPLVYCVERADLVDGPRLDDLVLDADLGDGDTARLGAEVREDLLGGVVVVRVPARVRLHEESGSGSRSGSRDGAGWWPYRQASQPSDDQSESAEEAANVRLTAIPYYAWGNRRVGAMRVWIPLR